MRHRGADPKPEDFVATLILCIKKLPFLAGNGCVYMQVFTSFAVKTPLVFLAQNPAVNAERRCTWQVTAGEL